MAAVVELTFDSAGGSDTLASGAGPATALTGTDAAIFSGQIIQLTASTDLSGVSNGDCLYFESTDSVSNRRLFEINNVDDGNDRVTVVGTIVDPGGGVNWAIGGKRKTWENTTRDDWRDFSAGWWVNIDSGGTITLTATGQLVGGTKATGPTIIRSTPGFSTRAKITTSTNSTHLLNDAGDGGTQQHIELIDLELTTTGTFSKGFDQTTSSKVTIDNCVMDCTDACVTNASNNSVMRVYRTDLTGFEAVRGAGSWLEVGYCYIHDTGTSEPSMQFSGSVVDATVNVYDTVFDTSGTGQGLLQFPVNQSNGQHFTVTNCTFYNSATFGIKLSGATRVDTTTVRIANCIFDSNGTYGIEATDADHANFENDIDTCAFRNNTTADLLNATCASKITLTADPFTDASAGDFTLNATAGGGAACKGVGIENVTV